jgi:mono/diheme cytochrome c family protein
MDSLLSMVSAAVVAGALAACGGSGSSGSSTEYRIVAADGSAPKATVGDALRLSVVEVQPDGTTKALPSTATITWSGPPLVAALPKGSTPAQSTWPQPGALATSMWIKNADHLTDTEVSGVLYVLDRGSASNPTIEVKATVGGGAPAGEATATLTVAAFPTGNVVSGQTLYAANCAGCHGPQSQGTGAGPGLNNEADHLAGDPTWNGPMFAITPRCNMDNNGVSLATTMPKWLVLPGASGQLLATQDFADLYAFLLTQHGDTALP